jgi:hypothetical protein
VGPRHASWVTLAGGWRRQLPRTDGFVTAVQRCGCSGLPTITVTFIFRLLD